MFLPSYVPFVRFSKRKYNIACSGYYIYSQYRRNPNNKNNEKHNNNNSKFDERRWNPSFRSRPCVHLFVSECMLKCVQHLLSTSLVRRLGRVSPDRSGDCRQTLNSADRSVCSVGATNPFI